MNLTITSYKNVSSDNANLNLKITDLNNQIVVLNKNNTDCTKKATDFENMSKKLYSDLQALTAKVDVSGVNNGSTTVLIGQSLKADY